jgi:hypothetical protein
MFRIWNGLNAGALLLLASCASVTGERAQSGSGQAFTFPVIGDIPYSQDDAEVLQSAIIPAIRAGSYPFVIHVGDYKGGGAPCTAEADEAQLALIAALAPAQVFYTPGDNEWTDCDRHKDPETGEPQSELDRLQRVRDLFFADPIAAPAEMQVIAQPAMTENVTWRYEGVRFATMHIVATNNGRNEIAGDDPAQAAIAADKRDIANLSWLLHVVAIAKHEHARALVISFQADVTDVDGALLGAPCDGADASRERDCDAFATLRPALRDAAAGFGGPTLLIHGDTAPFTFGQSFSGDEAPNLWCLNAAGDFGHSGAITYGVQDATLVTIDPASSTPFAAVGLVSAARPVAE